jgi:predicted MFS family arabinose efflux permease
VTVSRARSRLIGARIAVTAIFLANGAGIGVWAASVPRLQAAFGLSDAGLGLALLGFAAGAIVAMQLTGLLCGRFGSKRVTIVGGLCFAAALPLPALAPGSAWLGIAIFVLGACNGAMDVAMNTNGAMVQMAWRGAIMSSMHAAFSLGELSGAGIAALLVAWSFGIAPTMAMPALAACLMVVAASPALLPPGRRERPEDAAHGFTRPRGAILMIGVLAFLGLMAEGAMVDWSAVYLGGVGGRSASAATAGFAAFAGAMAVCRVVGDVVVRGLGPIGTLRLGCALAMLGLALALLLPGGVLAVLGFGLVGLGVANVVPVLFSAAARVAGVPAGQGVAMAASLGYAGLLAGPPLIGFVAQAAGLRTGLLLPMLGLLLVAALAGVARQSRGATGETG